MSDSQAPTPDAQHPRLRFPIGVDVLTYRIGVLHRARRHPVLVGIYGLPDSGKSTLIKEVRTSLERRHGLLAVGAEGSTNEEDLRYYREMAELGDIQVIIAHCGWERVATVGGRSMDWLDQHCRAVFDREQDLAVRIYDPNSEEPPLHLSEIGHYNLVIRNDNARRKLSFSNGAWRQN